MKHLNFHRQTSGNFLHVRNGGVRMSSKLQQVETFALLMWTISYLDPLAVAPSVKLGDLNAKFVQLQTLMNSKLYVRLDQDLDPT